MRISKLLLAGLLIVILAGASQAAEWTRAADFGLALTQSSYNTHWVGGEAGSVNWIANANAEFTGKFSPHFTWDNTIKLSFGQSHTQDRDTKVWARPEKSADRIFIESVERFNIDLAVNPYTAVTFESQFLDNSVPEFKRYLNPFTLTESAGMSRVFADTTELKFITRFGVALRHYSDNAVVDLDKGDKERTTKTSGGLEWVTDFSRTFAEEKLKYDTKLRTFVALFSSDNAKENDDWKAPHVAWEHTLAASITKVVQVQLFVEFLYDKEISTAMRFKETLALGLSYKVF